MIVCMKAQPVKNQDQVQQQADAIAQSNSPASCSSGSAAYQATVLPIIQSSCISCHRTQAPLMNTASEVSAQGTAIVAAVAAGRMPPGRNLADADVVTLQTWADGGFPQLALTAVTKPTYEDSIKPMVMTKCAWCHSATAAANVRTKPYLTTYASVKAQAASLYEKMSQKEMPPRSATPTLSTADTQLFAAWQAAGYPQGTPTIVVPAGQPVYYLGTIDAVLASNCVGCHKPGVTAPDLSNYQAVEALGSMVLTAIQSGKMPPSGPLQADVQGEFKTWSDNGYLYDGNGTVPPPPDTSTSSGPSSTETCPQ